MWPINICTSCMRGVSFDGTFIQWSHNSFIFPPPAPVKPTVMMPFSLQASSALIMLGELPEVDIPIKTSPSLPIASTWRENKYS